MRQFKIPFYALLVVLFVLPLQSTIAQAQRSEYIKFSKDISDYGPVFIQKIKTLLAAKGGTLYIDSNVYPVRTPIVVNYVGDTITINIVGKKGKNGKLPILIDADTTRAPHAFLHFSSNISKPSLIAKISNLQIVGNNVPYSAKHPFVSNIKNSYSSAVSGINLVSCIIDNVTIRNMYGTGIILANYNVSNKIGKQFRMQSPKITNCRILNVWAYNAKDQSGDAIATWGVNKLLVQNNVLINDLATTKFGGRVGLVLEHYTEDALVKNNKIGGYNRNIHIECDYGGHIIDSNTFTQSSIAVTLSEDCNQPEDQKNLYSPITIKNNTMVYKQEFKKYNINKADYAFISVHRPSFVLDGLSILNNTMTYTLDKAVDQSKTPARIKEKEQNIYIELRGQPNTVVKGNIFK